MGFVINVNNNHIFMEEKQFRQPLIGKKMPDLEVEIYHENQFKKVNLQSYLGQWVILFFYPADFTFVCPTELKEMAQNYSKFQELGAEVLSVSTDTAFVHKAWHDHSEAIKNVEFPMVADPTGDVCQFFGTYLPKEGLSLRGTFIIDPDGIIRTMEIHDNNIGRSASETLRKLQAAIFVRQHGGEVCPANWQPGEQTLKPGINLVGKI